VVARAHDIATVDVDVADVSRDEPGQELEDEALAAGGRADDAEGGAGRDVEVHAAQDVVAAKAVVHAVETDGRGSGGGRAGALCRPWAAVRHAGEHTRPGAQAARAGGRGRVDGGAPAAGGRARRGAAEEPVTAARNGRGPPVATLRAVIGLWAAMPTLV